MKNTLSTEKLVTDQRDFFNAGETANVLFRIEQLKKLKQVIIDNESQISDALKKDLNKSQFEAYSTEIGIVLKEISDAIKHLKSWAKPKHVLTPLFLQPGNSFIIPEPLGVILIIAPWNYPFQLSLSPLIGALAAGNCAILKPSNLAPETSKVLSKLLNATFESKYVSVVEGGQKETSDLLEQKLDKIFFTGSDAVGKIVMEAAAKNLTPFVLELGGKSPCIVDETADIKLAARRIAWGKTINAGQTCVAPDYLLVQDRVKDEFIAEYKKNIIEFWGNKPEENEDFAKIVNQEHFDRLSSLIKASGKVVFGGDVNKKTQQIAPTLIDNVVWEAPILQEEIFGPLLPIISFGSLPTLLPHIKEKPLPLALYLFSNDKKNQEFVMNGLQFGGGCINDTLMHLTNPRLPFGGVGPSGTGSYHGKHSFDTFSHHKSVLKKPAFFDAKTRYAPYTTSKLNMIHKFLH
jgi:aldehyde dehydrogenase (NAD+)